MDTQALREECARHEAAAASEKGRCVALEARLTDMQRALDEREGSLGAMRVGVGLGLCVCVCVCVCATSGQYLDNLCLRMDGCCDQSAVEEQEARARASEEETRRLRHEADMANNKAAQAMQVCVRACVRACVRVCVCVCTYICVCFASCVSTCPHPGALHSPSLAHAYKCIRLTTLPPRLSPSPPCASG
jgi:hypothetical protein